MKQLLLTLAACAALTFSVVAPVAAGQTSSSGKTTKKSKVPGSKDGKYEGGTGGSSHKGGTYKNPKTDDHDRDRKDGVSK